jgi:hypothetical protein
MSVKVESLQAWQRQVEKNLSREMDAFVVSQGARSDGEIAIQNDFFAALNLSDFKVSAIGSRHLERDE